MKALTVLVLAVGGNVSQGILKALAKTSIPCRILGADISPPQMGLYTVDKAFISPWAHEEEAFKTWLWRCCREEKVDVVLSGAEPVLMRLADCKEALESECGTQIIVSSPEVMAIGDDKLYTCRWLKEKGLATPDSASSESEAEVHALLARWGYPLIAKPRIGGGARGLILVEDEHDLAYVLRKKGYVVQELLGEDSGEYTVGCFCDSAGNLNGSITMRRDLLAGTTYRAEIGDYSEVREMAEKIVTALSPMGPCNVQLRMTQRGPVCFEINPRFSGTTPIRAHYGFNEVEASLRHFVLGEPPMALPKVTQGVALRYWNELYVDPTAVSAVEATGSLMEPKDYPHSIEMYGAT